VLAYVFWHRPAGEARAGYEERQAGFHQALSELGLEGFQDSAIYSVQGAAWLGGDGSGYEDWYLVEGSFALDPLNQGATSGGMVSPHAEAARGVDSMAAGLYRLHSGDPAPGATSAQWIRKAPGTGYAELYSSLEALVARPGTSLWRRQMVLGPTPEFCLLAPSPADPPGLALEVRRVQRRLLWPLPADGPA
jgi:hypothetical protein